MEVQLVIMGMQGKNYHKERSSKGCGSLAHNASLVRICWASMFSLTDSNIIFFSNFNSETKNNKNFQWIVV